MHSRAVQPLPLAAYEGLREAVRTNIDFRLTRLLSVRLDIRDFVSRAVPPSDGRNRWMALVEIAFHF